MEKKCCVKGCNGKYEAWIDIVDDKKKVKNKQDRLHGRFPFCQKHFDKIFPYIQKKEQEQKDKEFQETGKKSNWFWAWCPMSIVEEALEKGD